MIAVATFVLLFLMFGSVLVPVKALVLNVLSLTATFGAMVWIFQDGHLVGLARLHRRPAPRATMPILMFCVAFGLSMDYEVFLLSRIKEEHDRTGDNTHARSRSASSAPAASSPPRPLLIASCSSRSRRRASAFIKLFGIGLALAVLMDAFVIRATLVPAFMRSPARRTGGRRAPLRRFHDRFGFRTFLG